MADSTYRTTLGPCSNPRGSRIFSYLLWLVHHTYFNAGLLVFQGRIEFDPGGSLKPGRTRGPPGPAVTRVSHVDLLARTPTQGWSDRTSLVAPC